MQNILVQSKIVYAVVLLDGLFLGLAINSSIKISTDTYQSGTSMSSVEAELRENLPSQLFREIRNLPSAKTRRKIIQEGRTPQGTVRHRHPGSVRGGLDETDFVLMADEHQAYSHEGIRHMATSLDRKKVALYVK